MPFAKESPFYHAFQQAIGKVKQSGMMDKINKQYLVDRFLKEQIKCDVGKVISLQNFQRFWLHKF